MIRGSNGLVGLALAFVLAWSPAAQAGDLVFDGSRAPVVLESVSDHFTGGDVTRLSFTVAPSWQPNATAFDPTLAQPGITLVQVAGVNDSLYVSIGEQPGTLNVANDVLGSVDVQVGLAPALLIIERQADASWSIRAAGDAVLGTLDKDFFNPAQHDRLHLQLGGQGYVGRIEGFEIRSAAGQPVVAVTEAGKLDLARPFSPKLGSYFMVDGLDNIPQRLSIPGIDQHGLFERGQYFALVRRNDELGLVFDWGGYLALTHHPQEPNILVPKNPDEAWAGHLRFPVDPTGTFSQTVFVAEKVNARPGVAFLQNGKRYQRLEDRQNIVSQTPVGQKLGEVWATDQLPSNFQFSQEGCFDVTTMDQANLQTTGCRSSLFEFPPIKSTDYTTPDKKVVPSGWHYQSYRDFLGGFTSSLATSEAEIANLRSDGSSTSVNIMGVKAHHNESTEALAGSTIARETSVALHQFSSSSFVAVLNPVKVYLNHCFMRHVKRAVPTAALPSYFSPTVTEKYGYDDRIGEACPEELWLPLADDGTSKDALMAANAERLIELHSTHYAYAITYGARGEQLSTFTKSALAGLAEDKVDVDDGIGFDVKQKIEGVPVEVGGSLDQTSSREANQKLHATDGFTTTRYACIGGSSCTEGKPDIGDAAIPIYLHLRPIDELLAPPYFDDPDVIIDFRQAVRAALERKLAVTPEPAPTEVKLVRIAVDEVACANKHWWLGDRLCGGAALEDTIKNMAVLIYGKHEDGTTTFLGDGPIVEPLATAGEGFVVPVTLNPKQGKEVVSIGFKLVPVGYAPMDGATLDENCGRPNCQVATWVSYNAPEAPALDPLNWFLSSTILPLAEAVVGPGEGKPNPYRNLEAEVAGSGTGLAFLFEPDFIGVDPRALTRYHQAAHQTQRALSLNSESQGLIKIKLSHLDINVRARFEMVDPASALGFPERRISSRQLPLPMPTELSDAAADRNWPGAWQIGLFNDGRFVVQYHVSYDIGGATRRIASHYLAYRDYQLVAMPDAAENIKVQGIIVTGLDETRQLFEQEVLTFGDGLQPQSCFHIFGRHPDEAEWNGRQRRDPKTGKVATHWEPEMCWSPVAIASQVDGFETRPPRDADPMPRYIQPPLPAPVAVTLPEPPKDQLALALGDATVELVSLKPDGFVPPPNPSDIVYVRQGFGFNGCDVAFGPLIRNVDEAGLIEMARVAGAEGFTKHPSIDMGSLITGTYPASCRSAANLSWPLYLRQDTRPAAGGELPRFARMSFGFNACDVRFGELHRNITEAEMIQLAIAEQAAGFTFHPMLNFGKLMLGRYPEACRSAANLSWPLYLRVTSDGAEVTAIQD